MTYTYEELFNLPIPKFVMEIRKLSETDYEDLLKNYPYRKDKLDIWIKFYFALPDNLKIQLLTNDIFFIDFIQASLEKKGNSYFKLSSNTIKEFILSRQNLQGNNLVKLLKEIPLQDYTEVTQFLKMNPDKIKTMLKELDYKSDNILEKFKRHERNPYVLYLITSSEMMRLYDKYNLLLNAKKEDNNFIFEDGTIIDEDFLFKLNTSHMNNLIKLLKKKNPNEKHLVMFMTAIKLYTSFGYDNSKKIIEDKFTYMNENAIKASAFWFYTDFRRQYRITHQEKFYSYQMLEQVLKALDKDNTKYFKNIVLDTTPEGIEIFMDKLRRVLRFDSIDKKVDLESVISEEIEERESHYFHMSTKAMETKISSKPKRESLSTREIYDRLNGVHFDNIELDDKGRVVPNKMLASFVLGNAKSNNDCLLRLILNGEALGLNEHLDLLIDDFYHLNYLVSENKNMSMHSLLDIIDVVKATFFELEPDETDLTLDAITKVLNSQKFCTESKEDILKRVKQARRDARSKYSSYIPYVSGKLEDGCRYEVLTTDYEDFITLGIDSGVCLKIGGKGEEFLYSCMTSKLSAIILIFDSEGNKYICPTVRNGNAIFGNGIDPEPDPTKVPELLNTLKECFTHIIKSSKPDEKIKFATISDLHLKDYFDTLNLSSIKLNKTVCLEKPFYNDIDKDEITNYILSGEPIEHTEYLPTQEFLKPRIKPFFYDIANTYDKERVGLFVTGVMYSSIDLLDISDEEKAKRKAEFQPVNIDDYMYIYGNNDWCILVPSDMTFHRYISSNDPRVKREMIMGTKYLRETYKSKLEVKIV